MNLRETEQTYALDLFPRRDVTIVRGEGATLWDDTGRAYIDCVAGFGIASIGHANREVAEAIAAQARTLVTCPSISYNDVRARLMEKLVAITPAGPTVIRLLPPLVITDEQLDTVADRLIAVLTDG